MAISILSFSCFLALLIIAAFLWKIKQKYELYRRRQVSTYHCSDYTIIIRWIMNDNVNAKCNSLATFRGNGTNGIQTICWCRITNEESQFKHIDMYKSNAYCSWTMQQWKGCRPNAYRSITKWWTTDSSFRLVWCHNFITTIISHLMD